MGLEIERKFLVRNDAWRSLAKGIKYRQGYLNSDRHRIVRVRTTESKGYLTIKGITTGVSRVEYEYEIPDAEASAMLEELCEKPLIEKNRYKIGHSGLTWQVDEYFGENRGLIVAEVELENENQRFEKPEWIGEEVTGDPRYFNSNLVLNPFSKWN